MTLIRKSIERRIADLPKAERDRRWLEWWAAGLAYLPPLWDRELATHRRLYRQYRRSVQLAEAELQE